MALIPQPICFFFVPVLELTVEKSPLFSHGFNIPKEVADSIVFKFFVFDNIYCSFDIKAQYEIKVWQADDVNIGGSAKHKVYTVKTQMNLTYLLRFVVLTIGPIIHNIKLALPALLQDAFPHINISNSD